MALPSALTVSDDGAVSPNGSDKLYSGGTTASHYQKPAGSQPSQWGHQTACCGKPVRTKALVEQSCSGFVSNNMVAKNSHRGHGDVSCWGKLVGFDERQAAATIGF